MWDDEIESGEKLGGATFEPISVLRCNLKNQAVTRLAGHEQRRTDDAQDGISQSQKRTPGPRWYSLQSVGSEQSRQVSGFFKRNPFMHYLDAMKHGFQVLAKEGAMSALRLKALERRCIAETRNITLSADMPAPSSTPTTPRSVNGLTS